MNTGVNKVHKVLFFNDDETSKEKRGGATTITNEQKTKPSM
jgi:hypothetical protein